MYMVADPTSVSVQRFAKRLGCTWIGSIRVQPELFATELCCHANVARQVEMVGGEAVIGYYICDYADGLDYQGVLHSVWRNLNGELIDITPFVDGRSTNTFALLSDNAPRHKNAFMRSLSLYETSGQNKAFYIYMLVDPRDKKPFYVGKGTGQRARQHLWNVSREHNSYKNNKICEIRRSGHEPHIVVVSENIADEALAYDIESRLISFLGRKGYEANGVLTNVCLDNRPPNHRGKTYEEIYGAERAAEQKAMRTELQRARGGYGPREHSEKTKELLRISTARRNTGVVFDADRKTKIGAANSKYKGNLNKKSHTYVLNGPYETFTFHGWAEVADFCKANNLSHGTFQGNIYKDWPPSIRGKNAGWVIRIIEQKDS